MNKIKINNEIKKSIKDKLNLLYGNEKKEDIYEDIFKLIQKYGINKKKDKEWFNEKDIILITYPDQIKDKGKPTLKSLHELLNEFLKKIISHIHILPFFPYSSDDGFSIIDYFKIKKEFGDWSIIKQISKDYSLMYDAVINHISSKSNPLKGFLKSDPQFENFFIKVDKNIKGLEKAIRPRALPLLTDFKVNKNKVSLWTTFSKDQVDLNYKNEKVFLFILEVLLFYIKNQAKIIRLDAVAYLWKEIGTKCIHLKQTHIIIQLFRLILEIVNPEVIILTETNVPYEESISYFGNGNNEAHMVYQFSLPPLVLHAILSEKSHFLNKWASNLKYFSEKTTYLNFLASHDGIGINPAKNILPKSEIKKILDRTLKNKGYISYKNIGKNKKIPYELNINFFDAISLPDEDENITIKKFLSTQSILLTLKGVPAIYFHSLFGSKNYYKGVAKTGEKRSINREKYNLNNFKNELNNPNTLRYKIFYQYTNMIKKRIKEEAFHPNSSQKIIYLNNSIFSFIRTSNKNKNSVLVLHNLSNKNQRIKIELKKYLLKDKNYIDLISYFKIRSKDCNLKITLKPFEFLWLK